MVLDVRLGDKVIGYVEIEDRNTVEGYITLYGENSCIKWLEYGLKVKARAMAKSRFRSREIEDGFRISLTPGELTSRSNDTISRAKAALETGDLETLARILGAKVK